jgi:hypothetical protein
VITCLQLSSESEATFINQVKRPMMPQPQKKGRLVPKVPVIPPVGAGDRHAGARVRGADDLTAGQTAARQQDAHRATLVRSIAVADLEYDLKVEQPRPGQRSDEGDTHAAGVAVFGRGGQGTSRVVLRIERPPRRLAAVRLSAHRMHRCAAPNLTKPSSGIRCQMRSCGRQFLMRGHTDDLEFTCARGQTLGMVQREVARGRVDARTCRCATPPDQGCESAQDHHLGLVQLWVPFNANERQRAVGTSRAREMGSQLFLVSQVTSDQSITAKSWASVCRQRDSVPTPEGGPTFDGAPPERPRI